MRREEIAAGADHSSFLGEGDGGFRRAEVFIRPGLNLDENERTVRIDHNQIDLPGLAAKIAREDFEALAFEEFLAAPLAPSAEQFLVR